MPRSIVLDGMTYSFEGVSEDDPYYAAISADFEPALRAFVQRYLDEESVAFDVGANIGVTATVLSHLLPRGHVHAFEPAPDVYQRLADNIARNGLANVSTRNCALSDEPGFAHFRAHSAWGHLDSAVSGTSSERDSTPVLTVDAVVDELGLDRLDFLKIDVEGFEPQVLAGAQRTLERFRPVVYLELNSFCLLAQGGNDPLRFLGFLQARFPTRYRVSKGGDPAVLLERLEEDGWARRAFHDNVALHGSVDDLVVTDRDEGLRPVVPPERLVAELRGRLAAAVEEAARAAAEREVLRAEREVLQAERDALRAERDALQAERDALQAQRDDARRTLADVLGSRSWQVTAPLRDRFGRGRAQ